ncbi:MAG: hypothetical protein HGA38_02560 [Candidatus Moranbacteria bacterium]|nr:hypothetical protein [Candidatus Moranbacteria bacterium]
MNFKLLPKGSVLAFSFGILSLVLMTVLVLVSMSDRPESPVDGMLRTADSGVNRVLSVMDRSDISTISELAEVVDGTVCSSGAIVSSDGWRVTFYEGADGEARMTSCSDADWRTRVTTVRSEVGSGGSLGMAEVAVAAPNDVSAGMIIMWSGSASDIPDGWALCDGSNGTPDLRNRFVVGSGGSYGQGSTGGSADSSISTANMPSHQHYVANSDSHVGGLSSSNYVCANSDHGNGGSYYLGGTGTVANVGLSSPVGNGQAFSNMPPYLALAYIMKL